MRRVISILSCLALAALVATGCGNQSSSGGSTTAGSADEEPAVKSMDEYREEASEDITEEEAEEELRRLQEAVEKDIESGG